MSGKNKSPAQKFSWRLLCKSFAYAAEGICFTVRTQRNMVLHILAACLVCTAGFWLQISLADWRWLIACIALVWCAELLNTAIEYVCDVVMPEQHNSVKYAKDIAAGAVLVVAIAAVFIGGVTFFPYLEIMQ